MNYKTNIILILICATFYNGLKASELEKNSLIQDHDMFCKDQKNTNFYSVLCVGGISAVVYNKIKFLLVFIMRILQF